MWYIYFLRLSSACQEWNDESKKNEEFEDNKRVKYRSKQHHKVHTKVGSVNNCSYWLDSSVRGK